MPAVAFPELNLGKRLPDVAAAYYDDIFKYLEELRKNAKQEKPDDYKSIQYAIANYLYLIHERLHLDIIREIDYGQIQNFATKNKDLVSYLFEKKFPDYSQEAVNTWIEPSFDMIECGLYRPSNKYTKNVYH